MNIRIIISPAHITTVVLLVSSIVLHAQDAERITSADAYSVTGSVLSRIVGYSAQGIADRRVPLSYVFSGTVNINLADLALPFTFTYSEQARSFAQPFNQIGVSPRYKWITAHAGYRNVNYSPFTLGGHQFLGWGVDLTPGNWRISAMNGEFQSAVEEDTLRLLQQLPAYRRTGWAAKLGYGDGSTFIDVSVLKARDDTSSLRLAPRASDVLPAENLVLGASTRIAIAEGVSAYADAGASSYTRDVRSDVFSDNSGITSSLSPLLTVRQSTNVFTALQGGLSLNTPSVGIDLTFSRIDPDYKSMGIYFINNDQIQWSVTPSLTLFDNMLRVRVQYQRMNDNVQGKKLSTTHRENINAQFSYAPSAFFGVDVSASTMNTSQRDGTVAVVDSLRMNFSNPSLTVTPRYTLMDSLLSQTFVGMLMVQRLSDGNARTAQFSQYTSLSASLGYVASWTRSGISINCNANHNSLTNSAGTFSASGISAGGTASMYENTLSLGATTSISLQTSATVLTAGVTASYRPHERHTIELTTTAMRSASPVTEFQELSGVLSYVLTF
ncbi:MAG: hypothetical protein JNL32_05485 [Candidatus Kapabacteria bacterium]|nr:hypothetical protein [Candidatus Kapabacteria bacterium]